MQLTYYLFSLALVAQILTVIVCLVSYQHASDYRFGWISLALGFTLMLAWRADMLLHFSMIPADNILDAFLSVLIAACLLWGVIVIRLILLDLERKKNQLENLVKYDQLTGAWSRIETVAKSHSEIERSLRTGKPLAFLMLDIDYFKKINDSYGHQVGDEVLKNVTIFCLNALRKIDVFGRVGGEEFLIVLPETDVKQAVEVASRLCKNLAQHTCYQLKLGPCINVTVSIGVAIMDPMGEMLLENNPLTFEKFFNRADEAMYQAKKNGRNQISVWDMENKK